MDKLPEECKCVDPLRPTEKLFQCGSELCKYLQIFYDQYIKEANANKKNT